ARASATTDLYHRGCAHGVPGEQVDGMDVRAVKAAGEKAIQWARSGKGPIILEMLTYRYRGHSMSDPAKYRSKEEVDKIRTEHDPIEQVRQRLIAKKFAAEETLKKIDQEVRAIVNEAAEFATHDVEPDPSELYTDVYKGSQRDHAHTRSDARAVSDDGEGQSRQVAQEGRRRRQIRRCDRRDRDRQGHHGGGSGR